MEQVGATSITITNHKNSKMVVLNAAQHFLTLGKHNKIH